MSNNNNRTNLVSKIIYIAILFAILFVVEYITGGKQPLENNAANITNVAESSNVVTSGTATSGKTIAGTNILENDM